MRAQVRKAIADFSPDHPVTSTLDPGQEQAIALQRRAPTIAPVADERESRSPSMDGTCPSLEPFLYFTRAAASPPLPLGMNLATASRFDVVSLSPLPCMAKNSLLRGFRRYLGRKPVVRTGIIEIVAAEFFR